ncbi:MAG TPA: NnrU family protein [Methyloceanibacter sp.]|nr:NnrU family protein [Methyloceanibacter sp.]
MTLLILGIVVFLGVHLLPTLGNVRANLVARLGENGYRALFSLASIAGFVLLVWGFAKAPVIQIWSPPGWTRWMAIALMLPAFIFLVAAYIPGEIKAKLKHPFLIAIKTWALAHLIANGDLASIILFGSFLAYAVYDRITLKRRQPTSLIETPGPGSRRNDLIAVLLGTALYLAFLIWLHPLLIGRPVMPH